MTSIGRPISPGSRLTRGWRGVASRDLDAKASPEKKEKNINKAAEKIFKNYPPASR